MPTLDKHHPKYDQRRDDWILLQDSYDGERAVKAKGDIYLPVTSGMHALGMGYKTIGSGSSATSAKKPGQLLYEAYLKRAVFPELVRQTVAALVGVMVREPWAVELPTRLQYLDKRATNRGDSLEELIRWSLQTLLLHGRLGLLNDIREATNEVYIVKYDPLCIINWDDTPMDDSPDRNLRMVVLDESGYQRNTALEWEWVEKYRLLTIESPVPGLMTKYTVQVENAGTLGEQRVPALQGNELDYLPFTFINATDLAPEPGEVPLMGLARLAIAMYRGEADYRHSLFMQGQDTLVVTGAANPGLNDVNMVDEAGHVSASNNAALQQTGQDIIIGAGAVIFLPDSDADAKFIGVESKGLEEQRAALENDQKRAESMGLALLTSGSQAEASDTVHTRVTARTASLASIVRTAAAGLEQQLRWAAEWAGANPDDVKIEPNLDFIEDLLSVGEVAGLWALKMQGFPISARSIHNLARKGELTEMTLEQELEEIADEPSLGLDDPAGEDDPANEGGAA